jgi:hypothetical protein
MIPQGVQRFTVPVAQEPGPALGSGTGLRAWDQPSNAFRCVWELLISRVYTVVTS